MYYGLLILALAVVSAIIFFVVRWFDKDRVAQRALDKYLKSSFSNIEIGRLYERYIGHLYETEGYDVVYHGAINGAADMGRDLIVESINEVLIIQTKYWAKSKFIPVSHIFQLFGSMTHFKRTSEKIGRPVKAVLYTTAKYSKVTKDAARVLGVELRNEKFNRSYPMIKCKVSANGANSYYLPFDPDYDKIKIDLHRDEHFVKTVKEATEKGFRRAG